MSPGMKSGFINTLPYISNPVDEFSDFKFVSWERKIYPKLVGEIKQREIDFFANLIQDKKLKDILDFAVGGGTVLSEIARELDKRGYKYNSIEANEVELDFIMQSLNLFYKRQQNILIHNANRLDLPEVASPGYDHKFDFGFLTGNSLTYVGGGSREYTKRAQTSVINKFAKMIDTGGYLLVDTRDYDFIKSLMHLPPEKIMEAYTFDYTTYYHGAESDILVFPAYISETVVVLHYYDKKGKQWSKLDLYPIYHTDMMEMLSKEFEIEKVRYDFDDEMKERCVLRQYLARKK